MFDEEELIFKYTRKQAIEDGVLVDVSSIAREAGFKYPVAITRTVWESWIAPDNMAGQSGESESGRLWDVLFVLRAVIRKQTSEVDTVFFSVLFTKEGRKRLVRLKSLCGPGDDLEPVITIMRPDED